MYVSNNTVMGWRTIRLLENINRIIHMKPESLLNHRRLSMWCDKIRQHKWLAKQNEIAQSWLLQNDLDGLLSSPFEVLLYKVSLAQELRKLMYRNTELFRKWRRGWQNWLQRDDRNQLRCPLCPLSTLPWQQRHICQKYCLRIILGS